MHLKTRYLVLVFLDVLATYLAYMAAAYLTDVYNLVFNDNEIYFTLGILALINVAIFSLFKMYSNLWEYASVDELIQIIVAASLAALIGATFLWIIGVRLPIRVYFAALILLVLLHGGMRLAIRISRSKKRAFSANTRSKNLPRTLIVGAGETGSLTIDRMTSKDPLMPGKPVVAVDDEVSKHGLHIHGVRVEGSVQDIPSLVEKFGVSQIVVAIPSATLAERKRIFGICSDTSCKLLTLPNIKDIDTTDVGDIALRDVDVNDLLGRAEIVLDTRFVSSFVQDECVLVTGGGGSIGSELVRQLCPVAPRRIVLMDMYENDAYMTSVELSLEYPNIDFVVEIGNICDSSRVNEVFKKHRPSLVFHAAAHKHVPLMEQCPREAVQNNVFGTLNVVRCSDTHNVRRFIFISTDKAVNPTSVMGATKRLGEMVVQYYAKTSKTIFSAVRFGNVLGSNGSVIPLFKKQIASGGPVTVTHPDIERYFMTIPEASRLVIHAGGMARGGEIFILDMGQPVKITSLANSLIKLSGLVPDVDIKIEYTGLREGEKLYEELLMCDESTVATADSSIMITEGHEFSHSEMASKLEELSHVLTKSDDEAIKILEHAVSTYTHTSHLSSKEN